MTAARTPCPTSRRRTRRRAVRARGDDLEDLRRPAVLLPGQRGIPEEEAIALIVNGFVKEVIQELPMEFAVEAQKLAETGTKNRFSEHPIPELRAFP
jgi:hypothetical protein